MTGVQKSVASTAPDSSSKPRIPDDEAINARCEGLIKLAIVLQNAGQDAVSTEKGDKLTQSDKDDISIATKELLPTLRHLANEIFEPLRKSDPNRCKDAYELTWQLLSVVTRLAGQVIVTDSTPNLYRAEFSKEAGRKSGASRRKIAAETWQPHATDLAQEIVAEGSAKRLSQDKIVEEIRRRWRLKRELHSGTTIPSHATLKKFVAQLQRDAALRSTES